MLIRIDPTQPLPNELRRRATESLESYLLAAATTPNASISKQSSVYKMLEHFMIASDYISRFLCRNPCVFYELQQSGSLIQGYGTDAAWLKIHAEGEACDNEIDLKSVLRSIRNREMIRIAWRDLFGVAKISETTRDLAKLADVLLQVTYRKVYQWQADIFGYPIAATTGTKIDMWILGLGKLGGNELNFSSDIDLVFGYPEAGKTEGGRRTLSNQEFFTRIGQRLIAILQDRTIDGFAYRIDMRLRPNGNAGPLVLSANAFLDYYANHGRDWERYALIKARPVAGDLLNGAALLSELRPFVYRKYLDYNAFSAIREMRALINREFENRRLASNIKLGSGGIREIEFFIQSLQLLRGGQFKVLQQSSFYAALQQLRKTKVLKKEETRALLTAYNFLRQVENRLQMANDQQTHDLPEGNFARMRLAYSMGFSKWEQLITELNNQRATVRQICQLIEAPTPPAVQSNDSSKQIWFRIDSLDACSKLLAKIGYDQPNTAANRLMQFRQSSFYLTLSVGGRNQLDLLLPRIIERQGSTKYRTETLHRTLSVIEAIGKRSVYLSLLVECPMALQQLLNLCETSLWMSRWIARYPIILDDLISPLDLWTNKNKLHLEARKEIQNQRIDNLEDAMDMVRIFHHSQLMRVAYFDLADQNKEISGKLSDIAEVSLTQALEFCIQHLARNQPDTQNFLSNLPAFIVVAYGKLGSRELSYNSDLDLIFLYQNTGKIEDAQWQKFFTNLTRRLISFLSTETAFGNLYEIDIRLRPSGRSGMMVTNLDSFARYQLDQAWTWEHQALVHARAVAGNEALRNEFENLRLKILTIARDQAVIRKDCIDMREKMWKGNCNSTATNYDIKLDHGGMVDIEFIAQYLVLTEGKNHPLLCQPRSTSEILRHAERAKLITTKQSALLVDAYQDYLRLVRSLKLHEKPLVIPQKQKLEVRRQVSRAFETIILRGDESFEPRHDISLESSNKLTASRN